MQVNIAGTPYSLWEWHMPSIHTYCQKVFKIIIEHKNLTFHSNMCGDFSRQIIGPLNYHCALRSSARHKCRASTIHHSTVPISSQSGGAWVKIISGIFCWFLWAWFCYKNYWIFRYIGKNNNTRTVQAESSKFASVLFDQGFQIIIPPRSSASVPEPIGTLSDDILHRSDCCYLRSQF